MLVISSRIRWWWSILELITGLICMSLVSLGMPRQDSRVGRVVGQFDGIRFEGKQFQIWGWACQKGTTEPIEVHISADHSSYDTPEGTFVLAGEANLANEPSIDQACQDHGSMHRFMLISRASQAPDSFEKNRPAENRIDFPRNPDQR